MSKINVVLVDDHEIFREGLKLVLHQIENICVVAEFSSGDDFIKGINEIETDIVLLDINMPGIDGIKTTQQAIKQKKDLLIIGLTMLSDEASYLQMIENGAKGFVLKKSGKYELNQAIQDVYNGGNYFSQEILQKLAFRINRKSSNSVDELTNRENEILVLICKGLSTKQISEVLFISPKTIEVHRSNILSKTGCKNIAQLVVWAIENGVFAI